MLGSTTRRVLLLFIMLGIFVGCALFEKKVEVTLPGELFEEGKGINEITAEAKRDGVREVTLNDDGSITYTMSKDTHKEMMKEAKAETLEYIEEIITGTEYASIKEISYNKSFSEFTLVVDQEAFESSFDAFVAFGLGVTGMFYQSFDGADIHNIKVTIHVKNIDSREIFHTIIFPDAFEEWLGL